MSLKYALVHAVHLWSLILGNPLSEYLILDRPPSILNGNLYLNSTLNESVTSLNVTGGNDMHIQCDGASYGFDLDIVDCEQAKAYIPVSSEQVQWAERHTGWQKEIFLLPYRAMGDKALCYVQPVLIDGATSARANSNQVRNAAAAIRHKCASGGKLQGGNATNIGGDNNLAVIMAAYQPTSEIQCRGLVLPITSCEDVLEDMPVTSEVEVFGPQTDTTAKVWLPQAVESDDTKCLLTIYGTSPTSDKTSWYEVWEATTAIWSVCVRHGLRGSMTGFGKFSSSGVVKHMANAFGSIGDNGKLLLTMTATSDIAPGVKVTSNPLKGPTVLRASKWYGEKPGHIVERPQA